ncbi:MAG TPA: indolepyruvate oxidoreductase subunit beta, partial [Bacteroidetes bacterium]|nr:indolepyruvate oxidoreductase subunit beta [Bacteroidota bacterium]
MQDNIILAGVGGQGILSIAAVLAMGALSKGLFVKQSEVHGMSQRGGAVQSHIRISDKEIQSVLIPKGHANAIISVEPMESLRYIPWLSDDGWLITNIEPYKIPGYPDMDKLKAELEKFPNHVILEAGKLAKKAGNKRAANMVVLGAATPFLSIGEDAIIEGIKAIFSPKGERMVELDRTSVV